jgi:protein arginine kinase activator
MRCDNCGTREAVIHLTQVENNEMNTHHLCEACAAEKGLDTGAPAATPLTDFLAQIGKGVTPEATATAVDTCPSCGMTLADFRRTGRLGCADCYVALGDHLRGLLRRLHGGTQHVGKVYAASDAGEADRAARVVSLRRSLQRAVDAEDFERAASLRDQIRRLEAAHN